MSTVLLNSGNVVFTKSAGTGSTTPLPVGAEKFLNDQLIKMVGQINVLEGRLPGVDGREVALKKGVFPEGSEETEDNVAILWKLIARDGEPERPWNLLCYLDEITGPAGPTGEQGPPGPRGEAGGSVRIIGSVTSANQLIAHSEAVVGDGMIAADTGHLWVLSALPPIILGNWHDVGLVRGPAGADGKTGATGPRGPRGPEGPKGSDGGGLPSFIVQLMVNSAVSAAISASMSDVMNTVNDAINDMASQLTQMAETAAENAVEKALEDAMDELKGEKGDKGDQGDKGEDGTSFKMVGKYDTLTRFMQLYPAQESNVGKAAMIGKDGEEKHIWAVTEVPAFGTILAHYTHEDFGVLSGPKGEDARWEVSIRDKDFVEKVQIVVDTDVDPSVSAMYIRDTDSIIVEGLTSSQADPKQVGLKFHMKYPIPTLIKDENSPFPVTTGKVLSNDGEKLKWVEGGTGGSSVKEEILLKNPTTGRVYSVTVDENGRVNVDLSLSQTDDVDLIVKSPNGSSYSITVNDEGRISVDHII